MKTDQLAELKTNEVLRMRLAKKIARDCFRRSSVLEKWRVAGQIDQEEAKALMIDVVNHCYDFLTELCSPSGVDIIDDLKQRDDFPGLDGP